MLLCFIRGVRRHGTAEGMPSRGTLLLLLLLLLPLLLVAAV